MICRLWMVLTWNHSTKNVSTWQGITKPFGFLVLQADYVGFDPTCPSPIPQLSCMAWFHRMLNY